MTAIKNDELFQTLLRYDSFLVRGDMSSSSFLATHLGSYCKEVDRALAGCNFVPRKWQSCLGGQSDSKA